MNGQSILVTGGTGSFGNAFVREILARWPQVRRLVVLSRDEFKQSEMARLYPPERYPQLRFFLGDVRSRDRLQRALEGIDMVVHAAALKQVPAAEYNPTEFIHTNIIGAENLIHACMDADVKRVVALSTDKASAPINLYGATKLCSDKLFVAANNFTGSRDLRFSVVRYGNVLGSRGSVVPHFIGCARSGVIPITDPRMTRFTTTLAQAVEMVIWAMSHQVGGETFVVKCPSFRILDMAEAIGPGCRRDIVGIRPGEKIHEDMVVAGDAPYTVDLGHCFAILPPGQDFDPDGYAMDHNGRKVTESFSYNSGTNPDMLVVAAIREMIRASYDPDFEPV